MEEKYLNNQLAKIKDELRKDLSLGFNLLLSYITEIMIDESIRNDILIMGSKVNQKFEDELNFEKSFDKDYFLNETYKLIDKISITKNNNDINKEREIRDYFITKRKNETVFLGTGIEKNFSKFKLDSIDLELKKGKITGVVGENGNGKSTLLKIIAGEITSTKGKLVYKFNNEPINMWHQIKPKIGYVKQTIEPWSNKITLKQHLHLVASLKGLYSKENDLAVNLLITRLGLRKYANFTWNSLSGGYKLRFELARQLVWGPELLIMDEPLANLDIKAQSIFLEDIRELANSLKKPLSVIMSSQNIYEMEEVADNIIFMSNGKAIYSGPINEISLKLGYSCFLFKVNCEFIRFYSILKESSNDILYIKEEANYKLVYAQKDSSIEPVITALLKFGVKILYYRDISNSTRVLFDNVEVYNQKDTN